MGVRGQSGGGAASAAGNRCLRRLRATARAGPMPMITMTSDSTVKMKELGLALGVVVVVVVVMQGADSRVRTISACRELCCQVGISSTHTHTHTHRVSEAYTCARIISDSPCCPCCVHCSQVWPVVPAHSSPPPTLPHLAPAATTTPPHQQAQLLAEQVTSQATNYLAAFHHLTAISTTLLGT